MKGNAIMNGHDRTARPNTLSENAHHKPNGKCETKQQARARRRNANYEQSLDLIARRKQDSHSDEYHRPGSMQ